MNIFRNPPELPTFDTDPQMQHPDVLDAITGATKMAHFLLNIAMQSLIEQERDPTPIEEAFHGRQSLSVTVTAFDSTESPDFWAPSSYVGRGVGELERRNNIIKVKCDLPERVGHVAEHAGIVFRARNGVWLPDSVWDGDAVGKPVETQRFSEDQRDERYDRPFYWSTPDAIMRQPIANAGLRLHSGVDILTHKIEGGQGPSFGVVVTGGPL